MSPRLIYITEQRAGRAFMWMIAGIIVATHAGFFTAHLFRTGSPWGALTLALTFFSVRMSWKAFRSASKHFETLERANNSH